MEKKSKPKNISRRRFLRDFGGGVVGSSIIISRIEAAPDAKKSAEVPPHKDRTPLSITVNGKKMQVLVEPRTTLADFLRVRLKLTGTKIVCNQGECGGCTVLLDGKPVYSCHMLALDAAGHEVTTIEGLMTGEKLHPIQEAFIEHDGLQCGFCTPGQIMAAQGLLLKYPKPNRDQLLTGMSGNLCRCSAYPKIMDSVAAAAEKR